MRIPDKHYDIAIIGGGINGIGLFRDLSKHGVNSILIEKGDFMSQTSSRSSKMLHGGIRYLENFDFPLIQEALHEKNIWVKLAPHLCQERAFYLPVFNYSKFPLWMTYCGLKIYDFLSNFKNTPSTIIKKKRLLSYFPSLTKKGLKGAAVYYDAYMNDARLGIECLLDGLNEKKGHAYNYMSLEEANKINGIYELKLKCQNSGETHHISAADIVFTTGPFTDRLLKKLNLFDWKPRLCASKGSHIWLSSKSFPLKSPMVLQTHDKRVLFVLPQKDGVLVGTTEEKLDHEEFFNIEVHEKEINYMLNNLKKYFPGIKLSKSDIIGQFAGVRPLVMSEESSAGETSREHKVFQPMPDAWVLLGGKWTTFRVMVQDIARPLVNKYNPPYDHNKCIAPLNTDSPFSDFEQLKTDINIEKLKTDELAQSEEDIIDRRLGRMYRRENPSKPSL